MGKIISKIEVDYDDSMSVYNLVADLNPILNEYGLSIEVEDEEHDGFDVVILKEIKILPDSNCWSGGFRDLNDLYCTGQEKDFTGIGRNKL